MKSFQWAVILMVVVSCSQDKKVEILTATQRGDDILTKYNYLLRLYSDSTYTFNAQEYQPDGNKKNEIFTGRYHLTGDSVVFSSFDYLHAATARISNNYLEFLDGKRPFKMKVVHGPTYTKIDTTRFKDYSFFTNDAPHYRVFKKDATPYDVTNDDLVKVETMLRSCLQEAKIKHDLKDYFKQCIATKNKNNERVVWINLLCNSGHINEANYYVIDVSDGGDCFLNVKLNLDTGVYYDLMINGDA